MGRGFQGEGDEKLSRIGGWRIFQTALWTAPAWPKRTFGKNKLSASRYYAGESSDFDVFYFSVFFTIFEEAIWTAPAWPKHTFQSKLIDFQCFGRASFDKVAQVREIHEKHSFYRSDFPELRSRLHNNTIRVVPACFFGSFWDAVLSHKARICRYLPLRFCISEFSPA